MVKRNKQEKLFYYSQPGLFKRKIESLDECEEKVIWLLDKFPHLRDCDKCLLFYYWREVHGFCAVSYEDGTMTRELLHDLIPAETITRLRRYIQNDLGLYLPDDPDTIKAREISEEVVRAWAIRNKNG